MKQSLLLFLTLLSVLFCSFTIETTETVGDPPCDVITLVTGEVINAEIVRTTTDFVEYRDCGNKNSELKTIAQSQVKSITHSSNQSQSVYTGKKRSSPTGLVAFGFMMTAVALGLLSILLVFISFIFITITGPLMVLAMVVGFVLSIFGLEEARRYPRKYTGTFALIAFLIGMVGTTFLIYLFAIGMWYIPALFLLAAIIYLVLHLKYTRKTQTI